MQRSIPRRRAGLALGVIAVSLTATACAPSAQTQGGADALTVWSWRVEDEQAYVDTFDAYTAAAEDRPTVDFRAFSTKDNDWATLLSTGLSGSDGPDITQMLSYSGQDTYVAADQLEPLDADLVPGLSENFSQGSLDSASVDGVIYGVPLMQVTMQVFYNKGLFADLGLDVPTTWSEFIALNDDILAADLTPLAVGAKDTWLLPQVFNILAGTRYDPESFVTDYEAGVRSFTDESFVDALSLFADLAPYLPENITGVGYSDAQSLFINGRAAMFPGGSYETGYFQSQNPDLEIGVFSVPVTPSALAAQTMTYGFADSQFALSAKAEDRDAALELLSYMATPEFGQAWSDATKQISAVEGVTPSDPLVREISDNYAEHPVDDPFVTVFNAGNPSTSSVVGTGLAELLSGRATPEDVAADIQAIVDTYKPFAPQG